MDWRRVKLHDICRLINGRAYKKAELLNDGPYPVLRVGNFFTNQSWYYSDLELEKDKYCENGDLLYAWSASFGPRVWQGGKVIYHYHIWKVDYDHSLVDKRFLYYWFDWDKEKIKREQGAGTTMIHVTKGSMEQRILDLPALPEQKRIVAILDEAFAGIATAVANTEKNLANARELFESYLNAVFSQRDKGWNERILGDNALLQIVDGDRGKHYPKKADFMEQGHTLFLNTKNVRSDGFNFDSLMFISEAKDGALRKGRLKRRDVILTTRGTIGNVAIYDETVEFQNIRINSGMLILRPDENQILSEYLFEVVRSSIFRSQISRLMSGAAQPQLPIKTLVKFSIPVPDSLETQKIIVADLRELQVESKRLESIYQQKLTALAELKQSLLQKAFSGELTAQTKPIKEEVAA